MNSKESSILEAIRKHPLSMADSAREAGLAFGTFKYRAVKLGVYNPNQSHEGRTFPNNKRMAIPLHEILEGKHPGYRTINLKRRMLNEGLLEEICNECKGDNTWNDKKIVLELDHINGIPNDHRKENLRLLCPNCHSQTPTFRGRKKK